jgi:hypothetical protein
MKILIPAAGRGKRINKGAQKYTPKVIFPVGPKVLCHWAHRVFKRWITSGEITQEDIVFIVRREEDEKFGLTKVIKERTHMNVGVCCIDGVTRGPAETVYTALESLRLDQNEVFFVSDCDHYFASGGILNAVQVNAFPNTIDVLLSTAEPHSAVPSWSYARLGTEEPYPSVLEIREKDPAMALSGAPGVVGCYGFKNVALFQSLFNELLDDYDEKNELYMSSVVSESIKRRLVVKAAYSRFAYPLGTVSEVESFLEVLPKTESGFEDRSLFCDIDGVLLHHEAGPNSLSASFVYPASPIQKNVSLIKEAFREGHYVALTTSRRLCERSNLQAEFERLGISYQDMLMSVADGPRYLINDRRPTNPEIDRAIALNVGRDSEFSPELLEAHRSYGDYILRNLTSGSGATTLELRRANYPELFIRKIVQSRNTSQVEVLKIQANWYRATSIPGMKVRVPTVIAEFSDSVASILDIERFEEICKLSEAVTGRCEGISQKGTNENLIEQLLLQINIIYEKYRQQSKPVRHSTKDLVYERLVPAFETLTGYLVANEGLKIDVDTEIILNEKSLGSVSGLVKSIDSCASKASWTDMGQDWSTVIHGDLTAENVLLTPSGPALIDPLGAKMDLYHHPFLAGVGLTSPFFDYMKLLQSLLMDYESWKGDESHFSRNGFCFVSGKLNKGGGGGVCEKYR